MPSRILVLFAHPALHKSRINVRLAAAIRDVDGVTFCDLYERYADLMIDVAHEQSLLLEHDIVVFQHPFYWYSSPAILKEWQDLVLQYGWAYGRGGEQLGGKALLSAITTGGGRDAYRAAGYNRFTIRQLLAPFDQTAHLCGMRYLPPFVIHATGQLDEASIAAHCDAYRATLVALRDGSLDDERLGADYLNRDGDAPEEPTDAR